MDLIYADKSKADIGILRDYEFDLAYGKDENNFTLTIDLNSHCMQDDYLVYMVDTKTGAEEPTEYGGIVDAVSVDTPAKMVTYSGRTWHGVLSKAVIVPGANQDYKIVNGNAHAVIQSLLSEAGLTGLFKASSSDSPINIVGYRFKRYTDLYSGISDMLAAFGGKLNVRYSGKMVVLSAEWLTDYSQDEEFDSSQVGFKISQGKNPVNHLICLGQGEMKNRHVIHLFADANGGIQPYATRDDPVMDSDYILDKRNQILFGRDEVTEVYDYSSAGITDNYVIQTTQPDNWKDVYKDYYKRNADGTYANLEATQADVLTLLTSQPSDWSTAYGSYFTSNKKSVEGVETSSYVPLTAKPTDWDKNWTSYFVHYWDGVQWYWNHVDSVSYTEYKLQTAQPSDWETNFGSYYKRKNEYKTQIVRLTDPMEIMEYMMAHGFLQAQIDRYVRNGEFRYEEKVLVGTGYAKVDKVKKGKKEIVPTWKKNTYFTGYSRQKAPDFAEGLMKYMYTTTVGAPTWQVNTYYTMETKTIIPSWKSNQYYLLYHDHYADLVAGGIERLTQAQTEGDKISINLGLLGEYDIGDIVGANENVTQTSVWQAITKKIVSIKNGNRSVSYKIGDAV